MHRHTIIACVCSNYLNTPYYILDPQRWSGWCTRKKNTGDSRAFISHLLVASVVGLMLCVFVCAVSFLLARIYDCVSSAYVRCEAKHRPLGTDWRVESIPWSARACGILTHQHLDFSDASIYTHAKYMHWCRQRRGVENAFQDGVRKDWLRAHQERVYLWSFNCDSGS